jgi:hypothetical protein
MPDYPVNLQVYSIRYFLQFYISKVVFVSDAAYSTFLIVPATDFTLFKVAVLRMLAFESHLLWPSAPLTLLRLYFLEAANSSIVGRGTAPFLGFNQAFSPAVNPIVEEVACAEGS